MYVKGSKILIIKFLSKNKIDFYDRSEFELLLNNIKIGNVKSVSKIFSENK